MNKFLSFFIFLILFLFGCERASDFNGINNQQINFSKNSPNLTDIDTISRSLINLDNKNALKKDLQNLYDSSWVKQLRVKTTHPETVKIDVKEYQPIAVLNEEFYLTQDGNLINPGKVNIKLEIVSLKGPSQEKENLLKVSHQVQYQLNRLSKRISIIQLSSDDTLRITTNDELVIVMNFRNFRDQLDRLEKFISFELISGKIDFIKQMDLRYKKGISVYFLS
tara:strand:+ start:102 stop:770 length:669 start_codon:yes stop_codon:yes gene_type:complete